MRIWRRPRLKGGGLYRLGAGAIEVTDPRRIELRDVSDELARRSGFAGVVDVLKVARHGSGDGTYLVAFECRPDAAKG